MALTKTYSIEIEGQKAQATVGQLKEEIARLEAELQDVALGSAEADAAIRKLGNAKGALKELEDAVDALNPKAMAGGLLDLASGVTGAFSVATVAAENFGLASAGSAEQVEKKMLQLLTVMSAFQSIHKALNSETQSVMKNLLSSSLATIKSTLGLGEAYTVAGLKARLFGTAARAALTATGIGMLLVAVGLLISNFDKVMGVVDKFKARFQPQFDFVSGLIDGLIAKARDLASWLTFGLIDDAATAAIAKAEEAEAKATEKRIANRKRLIAEEAAAGRSVYNLKQQQLADELKLLQLQGKKETEEYRDKLSEIRQLKLSHDKSLKESDEKLWKEALEKQKKASEEALKLAQEAYAKRRELEGKALEAERAAAEEARKLKLEQAKADGFSPSALLRVEIENLVDLQSELIGQGKRFSSEYMALQNQIAEKEKAIAAANLADKKKALEEKKRLQDEELAKLDEVAEKKVLLLQVSNATEQQITRAQIENINIRLAAMKKMGLDTTAEYYRLLLELKGLEENALSGRESLMDKILKNIFNISPKEMDKVKASLEQSFATIYSSLNTIADAMLESSFIKLEAHMADIDERLQEIKTAAADADKLLNEAQRNRENLEKQMEGARGARREAIIAKIAKEQKAEERLTKEKAKAAAQEQQLIKQKEAAEQKRLQLEAKSRISQEATMAITSAATAADAIASAVAAVKSSAPLPFPANLVAITASLAAVGAAIASAKKLGATLKESKKLKGGGMLDGPSHDAGGIKGTGRFANIEVEGNEFVVNGLATRNSYKAIETINRNASMRFIAVPEHKVKRRMAEGGPLEGSAAAGAGGADAGDISVEELQAIRAVLERIEQHAATTAEKEPALVVDDWSARKITQKAQRLDRDEQAGRLL